MDVLLSSLFCLIGRCGHGEVTIAPVGFDLRAGKDGQDWHCLAERRPDVVQPVVLFTVDQDKGAPDI
jgi:hypothetical protein